MFFPPDWLFLFDVCFFLSLAEIYQNMLKYIRQFDC